MQIHIANSKRFQGTTQQIQRLIMYLGITSEELALLQCRQAYDVEKTFLDYLDDMKKKDGRKVDDITKKINNIFSKLKQRNDIVVARTDKTNSIRVMKTTTYIKLVERHLQKDAVLTDYAHLQEVHKKAIELLATINDLVGENEYKYIKSTITKRAVPTVQLLIKDHKKIDESTGEYPSRLVVPAKNYTAAYPHVGQRGIFEILRKNEVNFTERNIQQASELKEKLEQLPIRKSDNTIITLDIEAMYPSVKFIQIERAVKFFLRNAPQEDKETARRCLELVRFGMANTLITFHGKYWEYGGADVDRKGLTIGGFESAGFADLVAAYILENTRDLFDNAIFDGIYRDDGFKVDIGKQTTEETCEWLSRFQSRVNELTGSECLQFTVDIWNPDARPDEVPSNDKVTICRDKAFPYLDLEMYWREEELKFRVHMKPNQVLKYLNKGSAHTNACFRAIPHGVLRRLTVLTSLTPETENLTIDQLYPEHIRALEKAKLPTPKVYPTLRES